MLKANGRPDDYYTFRLPYWDWRRETLRGESEGIFTRNKLGVIERQNDQPLVTGELFGNSSWDTACWYEGSGGISNPRDDNICDPEVNTGLLTRCPSPETCDKSNSNWPTIDDINTALSISTFDTPGYNKTSTNSFRNFLEGFDPVDNCTGRQLCSDDGGQRYLHNAVSTKTTFLQVSML